MKTIAQQLKNNPIKREAGGPKIEYAFQELGVEMQEFFKTNIWFLFTRYPLTKIRDCFKVCQEKDIRSLKYMMGVLKNYK